MNLTTYDRILLSTSGGKDSQAMIDYVTELAIEQGVKDKLTLVHCDLGRVEWPGTKALVEVHAVHYGLPLRIVTRPQGDLLQHVEKRGKWPGPGPRYCTSDHKRGQIRKVMTAVTKEHGMKTRILDCQGLRGQESPRRKKLPPFSHNAKASNGKRWVDTWLPIHAWSTEEVWARIKASGVKHHYAYDLGMPRVSCVFCIFAPPAALILAGKHNPALLDEYIAVEQRINHTFKNKWSLTVVRDAIAAGTTETGPIESWCM